MIIEEKEAGGLEDHDVYAGVERLSLMLVVELLSYLAMRYRVLTNVDSCWDLYISSI